MNDAGRIGLVIKGNYDKATKYEFLDIVYFGNASYAAKKDTLGNEPSENSKYWHILAKGVGGSVNARVENNTLKLSVNDSGAGSSIPEGTTIATNEDVDELMGELFGGLGGDTGSAGQGATSYVLPIASSDTLGGVKIGDGVGIGKDGTISVGSTGAINSVVATDEAVNEALGKVFGSN